MLYACFTVIYDFVECICYLAMHKFRCSINTKYHKIMYIIQVNGLEYMFTFHLI